MSTHKCCWYNHDYNYLTFLTFKKEKKLKFKSHKIPTEASWLSAVMMPTQPAQADNVGTTSRNLPPWGEALLHKHEDNTKPQRRRLYYHMLLNLTLTAKASFSKAGRHAETDQRSTCERTCCANRYRSRDCGALTWHWSVLRKDTTDVCEGAIIQL